LKQIDLNLWIKTCRPVDQYIRMLRFKTCRPVNPKSTKFVNEITLYQCLWRSWWVFTRRISPNFSVLDRALFQFLGVISRMNFILYGYQTHIATLSRFKLSCMICAINVTLKLAGRGKLSFNVNYHTKSQRSQNVYHSILKHVSGQNSYYHSSLINSLGQLAVYAGLQ
jgi:hypothetical protein